MRILLAVLILVGTTGLAVTAMLLVRRRAPDGSFFNDGDRAAGVFGVLATGFAVLLGFVVFLAFSSYDSSRTGAEDEALAVTQQLKTAQFFPSDAAEELTAELICYARSVAGIQWERMENGTLGESLNPWGVEMYKTLRTVEPKTASEQSAYDQWLQQTSDREQARNARIHGVSGVIPGPLWVVLIFTALMIFMYMLLFADSGERAFVQAILMGSVVAVMMSTLLLLLALDEPFHKGYGGLRPVAMERALTVIQEQLDAAGLTVNVPCTDRGAAIQT